MDADPQPPQRSVGHRRQGARRARPRDARRAQRPGAECRRRRSSASSTVWPRLALSARLAVPAARRPGPRPAGGRRRARPAALPHRRRRPARHRAQAGHRAARQGAGHAEQRPGTSIGPDVELRGDVHAGRRELRLRARRAGGRPRRRRDAVPARSVEGGALAARRRGDGRAGSTSGPTTRSTSCAAPRSDSPSPGRSTWPFARVGCDGAPPGRSSWPQQWSPRRPVWVPPPSGRSGPKRHPKRSSSGRSTSVRARRWRRCTAKRSRTPGSRSSARSASARGSSSPPRWPADSSTSFRSTPGPPRSSTASAQPNPAATGRRPTASSSQRRRRSAWSRWTGPRPRT